jgi:hypothetical protein
MAATARVERRHGHGLGHRWRLEANVCGIIIFRLREGGRDAGEAGEDRKRAMMSSFAGFKLPFFRRSVRCLRSWAYNMCSMLS